MEERERGFLHLENATRVTFQERKFAIQGIRVLRLRDTLELFWYCNFKERERERERERESWIYESFSFYFTSSCCIYYWWKKIYLFTKIRLFVE